MPRRYRRCLDIISFISLLVAIRPYTSLGRRPYAVRMAESTLHEAGHRPHVRHILDVRTQLLVRPPVRACRASVRLSR